MYFYYKGGSYVRMPYDRLILRARLGEDFSPFLDRLKGGISPEEFMSLLNEQNKKSKKYYLWFTGDNIYIVKKTLFVQLMLSLGKFKHASIKNFT